jgi:hypothetical protein
MAHNCHDHKGGESDLWTEVNYFAEIMSNFIITSYSVGETTDIFAHDMAGFEEAGIDLTSLGTLGIIVGAALGTYTTRARATIHKRRSTQNQENDCSSHSPKLPHGVATEDTHSHDSLEDKLSPNEQWLSYRDYFTHIYAYSSAFTFLFNLKVDSPSLELKLVVQILALLIGAGASIADTRSCEKYIKENGVKSSEPVIDRWTNFQSVIEFITEISSTYYFTADLIGAFADLGMASLAGFPLGITWASVIGGFIGILSAIGSTISHRALSSYEDGQGTKTANMHS